ncbi:voltage-gated potassium channel [Methanomicrobium sp. W14]|uniref:ion transporter n=1 Tax=Methanomicrobium sp. W14 TaxID=2817839 RepID=UPI001AE357B9|nr:ion transporter [Methanomicrobium sp. W14]MBP2133227.1 voltage-gated potassium channel [Methanomicrobium sp. W14]
MLKRKVYDILEFNDASDRIAAAINMFFIVLIIVSSASVILSSLKNFENYILFLVIDVVSVLVFTVEYILRLWCCTENRDFRRPFFGRIRYAVTPLAIIDLLAILPFYLPLFIGIDLRILRILRLFRIFRLFKLARYTQSFNLLKKVILHEKEALVMTLFILALVIVIASTLMYYAENSVQPEAFASIPHSMWWAVATLTTVGYGDVYPVTPMGKIMASVIAIAGIGFVALPTGILSSGYIREINCEKETACNFNISEEIEKVSLLYSKGYLTTDEFENIKLKIIRKY